MSFQGEEVHHVGQLGGDLDEGHGGRRQDDVVHLLGLELGGEDRVLVPPLDSIPDVKGAQGEEVTWCPEIFIAGRLLKHPLASMAPHWVRTRCWSLAWPVLVTPPVLILLS